MSAEDMEISMDFGHHVPAEDIDIDLEFAAGQNDEDLELGDYNQADEFQHFNSDNRDELMAEDDDASYVMADADEISYNETATAANDYDIVIGDTNVFSWQEHDATNSLEPLTTTDQNQHLNDIESKDADVDLISAAVGGSDVHLQTHSVDSERVAADNVEAAATVQIAEDTNTTNESTEVATNTDGVAARDFEINTNVLNENDVPSADNDDVETQRQQQQSVESQAIQDVSSTRSVDVADSYDDARVTEGSDNVYDSTKHSLANEPDNEPDNEPSAIDDAEPSLLEESHENDNDPEDEISYDQLEDGINEDHVTSSSAVAANEASNDQSSLQHTNASGEIDDEDDDFTAGNYQLGDDSFEHTEDQDGQEIVETEELQEGSPDVSEQGESAESVVNDAEDNADSGAGGQNQDVSAIVKRHTLVVHYGETDYQLVASGPDDDPSEYFFKDTSALDLPLGEFLTGIRNVISEEVSPLDELVLHIDGLGLEFSESMTNQILREYTFGHIISLYDSLVQNDASKEAIDAPELYMYLMVRPNCLQRLMALQVQAASGRCLTDVAVYREASPAQEIDDRLDGNNILTISPDYAEDELYDDEDQLEDGHESQEHALRAEHDLQRSQSEDAEAEAGAEPSHYSDEQEEVAEPFAEEDDEDAVDYDNLDLTPPQQNFLDNPTTNESTTEENKPLAHEDGVAKDVDVVPSIHDEQFDHPPSASTSATVTLDGNPDDEIDYDESDQSSDEDAAQPIETAPAPTSPKLLAPLDDEITWESENEEARNEQPVISQPSEQVSTTPGKRTRSSSDTVASAGDRKDVKRQRS